MKKIFILSFLITFFSSNVFSKSVVDTINEETQKQGSIGTNKNTTVNEQADNASSSNNIASLMATVAGGMFTAKSAQKAAQCSSKNPSACAMAVIYAGMAMTSFKQSGENSAISGLANYTGNSTDAYGNGTYDSGLDKIQTLPEVRDLDKNLSLLKADKNLSYDPKTGTMKLGDKTLKASDMSSKAAMAAAGLPSSLIDQAWAEAEKISNDAEKKVAALMGDKAGGMGGGGSKFTDIVIDESANSDGSYGANRANKAGGVRGPANVAGMSKSYYGTPIGVAMDDIFQMMNRRYVLKDKQDTFFNKTSAPSGGK